MASLNSFFVLFAATLLLLFGHVSAASAGTQTAGSTLGVKWYAGFLPVPIGGCTGESSQMFYWYFPSTQNPSKTTVYLEGGPGIPSTFSVFYGPGPFRLQSLVPPNYVPPNANQYEVLLNNN